jgi:hypothetical protein
MCVTEEPQLWYGWPGTAACTDVKKHVSLSVLLPDRVKLGPKCASVLSDCRSMFQARSSPVNRRAAAYPLAVFAESGTCFDGRGDSARLYKQ